MDLKPLLPFLIPLLTALAGGGAATFSDVTGAKAWKESNYQELARAEMVKERNTALLAQQELLIGLVHECNKR